MLTLPQQRVGPQPTWSSVDCLIVYKGPLHQSRFHQGVISLTGCGATSDRTNISHMLCRRRANQEPWTASSQPMGQQLCHQRRFYSRTLRAGLHHCKHKTIAYLPTLEQISATVAGLVPLCTSIQWQFWQSSNDF